MIRARKSVIVLSVSVLLSIFWTRVAFSAPPGVDTLLFTVNNLWLMIASALVFIMHLGFATLETGLTRAKNSVNILFKNVIVVCIGILSYALIGFNLMYPGEFNGWLGFGGWGLTLPAQGLSAAYGNTTYWTDFLFQAMFAATAATIVSGAVAERIKLGSFVWFALLFVSLCYPITGSWLWGGGWLAKLGFYDFAGSTLVHAVGGWGALMGAVFLGPRVGKYTRSGIKPIPGHSMPLATTGVFLLWLGWFGFNGGSVLSADPGVVSLVLVTTSIAAAAGGVGAALVASVRLGKPDLSMMLNGILAGLVGITAGADQMGVGDAALVGLISGVIVVFAVMLFDQLRVDDPVGAVSVHLVCGVWGTLAVGLFGAKAGLTQLSYQLAGIIAVGLFAAAFSALAFWAIKASLGLRVSLEEESEGLDLGEHAMEAYPAFQTLISEQ